MNPGAPRGYRVGLQWVAALYPMPISYRTVCPGSSTALGMQKAIKCVVNE